MSKGSKPTTGSTFAARCKTTARRLVVAPFRRFGPDAQGVAAVDFAIVALPFLVMLLATLELVIIYFSSQALETFTEDNSRKIMVDLIQQESLTAAQYKAQLCSQLPSLFNCNNFYVDVVSVPPSITAYSSSDLSLPALTFDAGGNVTNSWRFQPGNPGYIVVVRMMYQWSVFNLPLGLNLVNQSNGSRLLMATAVFKNELTN